MFQIHRKQNKVNVFQEDSQLAEIGLIGAVLNQWSPLGENLIDGYQDLDKADFNHARSGWLFPFPNRLEDGKYMFDDSLYHFPINEPANNNAIHGFLLAEPFQLYKTYNVSHKCILGFKYKYAGSHSYYPFSFDFRIDYHFTEGQLTIELSIENIGRSPMPFAIGWHPYFQLQCPLEDHYISLPEAELIELNERSLPTGKQLPYDFAHKAVLVGDRHYDDCFKFEAEDNKVVLSTDTKSLSMVMSKDWGYFQVFTPDERTSVALEPMTGTINCLNNKQGIVELDPGKKFQTSFVIKAS